MELQDARIRALGGSGENGRNCFLLEAPGANILLDCGVQRETTGGRAQSYPALTKTLAASLNAVILSHAHEDHCVALPYLYALGYRGEVYASAETADAAPKMMRKWMRYALSRSLPVPFDEADIARVRFAPLTVGDQAIGGLRVRAGRSGHTAGSLWSAFAWRGEGFQLFYSGDMCLCAPFLAVDTPPKCEAAILDCAYADKTLTQAAQYGALLQYAKQALANGERLLLPVPASGRGADMLLFLSERLKDAPIFAERAIADACLALAKRGEWLKAPGAPALPGFVRVVSTPDERACACDLPSGIFLTTDGMLSTPEGAYYLERFQKGRCLVLITGHAAQGTPGRALLSERHALANAPFRADQLTIKVHPDQRDARQLCEETGVRKAMLFHAEAPRCAALIQALGEIGVDAVCEAAASR